MTFRVENKFVISKNKVFEFKKWMKKNNYKILYPKRKINSVYFDNKNFTIYTDSLEGITPRKKIRLRTYSNNFLNINNKFNYEIKISSVEGRFKTSKIYETDIMKIFNGIYDKQYGMCYPVLNVIYEREYFSNNKSRITIDTNIKYFKIDGKRISKHSKVDKHFVVENKSKFAEQSTMLDQFIFENKRFSKYCSGIEKIQSQQYILKLIT